GPCGDFTGPSIRMLRLGDRGRSGRYRTTLRLRVAAADPQHVSRISVFLDGRRVRTFGTRGPVMVGDAVLPQAKRLRRGRHALTVLARDANGNDTTARFTIRKVGARVSVRAARRR